MLIPNDRTADVYIRFKQETSGRIIDNSPAKKRFSRNAIDSPNDNWDIFEQEMSVVYMHMFACLPCVQQ